MTNLLSSFIQQKFFWECEWPMKRYTHISIIIWLMMSICIMYFLTKRWVILSKVYQTTDIWRRKSIWLKKRLPVAWGEMFSSLCLILFMMPFLKFGFDILLYIMTSGTGMNIHKRTWNLKGLLLQRNVVVFCRFLNLNFKEN